MAYHRKAHKVSRQILSASRCCIQTLLVSVSLSTRMEFVFFFKQNKITGCISLMEFVIAKIVHCL